MAAPTSVVKSAQNASEIGWAFVPQYYTFVNKDPSRLHCFYTKRSTLIHSTEGEEATPCFGQQEIHEKFLSLNFDDCKVFVSNVDSQSSADGGIIVQVLGEMSNQAGPWRKFAQTFFLAEQPNGFFVLNDIFRYMKEDDDDAEDEPEAEPVTVTEDVAVSDTSLNIAAVVVDAATTPQKPSSSETLGKPAPEPVSTPAPVVAPAASPRVAEPATTPDPAASTQTALASQLNGFHPELREDKPPEQNAEPSKSASTKPVQAATPIPAPTESVPSTGLSAPSAAPAAASAASSAVSSHDPPKPKPETAAPTLPSTLTSTPNGRTVSPQSKSSAPAAAPSSGSQKPAEPTQPSAPKTWASLAASGKSAWGQGHLSSSQGVSSAPTPASGSVSETPTTQSQNRHGGGPPSHANPDRYPPVDSISTGSCFIKSVNENIDEKTLKEQLVKKFGPIKELDIIRNKACGFLEFERIDSAKKAIQMSMPFNLGGKGGIQIVVGSGEEYVINIESKRQPGERGRPFEAGPKRGFGDRGGRAVGGNYGGPGGGRGRGGMEGGPRGSGRGGGGTRGPGRGMSHPNK